MNQDDSTGIGDSQVEKMRDLVDYQQKSIVSRTLIDKSTGTVTVFAFDSGEGLSEHTAPFDAMVYILDGEAMVKIGTKTYSLVEGEMIVMPADISHELRAIQRFKMLLIMIKN
jgi:quercetin dioxygenase-like cupin family protein